MVSQRLRSIAPKIAPLIAWLIVSDGMIPMADAAGQAGACLGPCALVASQDGRTLYVACADAHRVLWVELPGGNVTRRIALPAQPSGLAISPDGAKLVVTCAAPQSTVAVLDAVSGEQIAAASRGQQPG